MRLNYIFSVISLLLSFLLAYWVYDMAGKDQARMVAGVCSFLSFSTTLIPLMGLSIDNIRVTSNVRTASLLFFVIMLIDNFCFAIFGLKMPLYVIVTGILILIGVAVIYKLSKMDDI